MKYNIVENEKDFVITLPLNGVKKENISLQIEKNTLQITALRDIKVDDTYKNLHQEFSLEKEFKLSLDLGDDVEQENIQAKMENGILHITLHKKEEALPKKIEIA